MASRCKFPPIPLPSLPVFALPPLPSLPLISLPTFKCPLDAVNPPE